MEHTDDLQFEGLKIILSDSLPSFTTDAVLLSDFANVRKSDFVADMGTGTGIILLLMYGRYKMSGIGFEVQKVLSDMAQRSFELNGLSDKLKSECLDYTECYREYNGVFDAAVCNPPYFDGGIECRDKSRQITRSQEKATIEMASQAANRLIKSGGKFFVCYPAEGMGELIYALKTNRLEPKRLRFVKSRAEKKPYLVLCEAKKDGGIGIKYDETLVISNADGTETDEIKKIYHRL